MLAGLAELLKPLLIPLVLTLFGVIVRELVGVALGVIAARRVPLRRVLWQVSYSSTDDGWEQPQSIELIVVRRRGRRISGKMHRVFPKDHSHRWAFEGRLLPGGELCIIYRSIDKDEFASNGTMILGSLTRDLWCGIYHGMPTPQREAELSRMAERVGVVKRIGANVQEEAHVELITVGNDRDDPVRRFLASIPAEDPRALGQVAGKLPRSVRRILLRPVSPSRLARLLWASTRVLPLPLSLMRRIAPGVELRPASWRSPSRAILVGDLDEGEIAESNDQKEPVGAPEG